MALERFRVLLEPGNTDDDESNVVWVSPSPSMQSAGEDESDIIPLFEDKGGR